MESVIVLVAIAAMAVPAVGDQIDTQRAYAGDVARLTAQTEASGRALSAREAEADASAAWSVWDALAACEARGEWSYGPHSDWGNHLFEGGLQFQPSTWDAFKPAGYPEAAYLATREQQIDVAERVLAAQGWGAWPTCSRKLGLR